MHADLAPPRQVVPWVPAGGENQEFATQIEIGAATTVDASAALAAVSVQSEVSDPSGEIRRRRDGDLVYTLPPSSIVRLTPGWVESTMCVAMTARGGYIADTLRQLRQAEENGYERLDSRGLVVPARDVSTLTTTAALVGLPVGGNYFHWLFEAVARALFARQFLGDDLQLLVPNLGDMEWQCLEAAGISRDAVIELPADKLVRVDELFVPPRGVRSVRVLPDAVRVLRDLAPRVSDRRRIYISRSGARRRRITNEVELSAMFAQHGFDVVEAETLSVREQMATFAGASVVAGLHGAGLANLVFAPPGTTVVEIQPEGIDMGRVMLYWYLSAVCGHKYVQVICPWTHSPGEQLRAAGDVSPNVAEFDALLTRIVRDARSQ
jgi:capsular polysaccharide biosynthesis protein